MQGVRIRAVDLVDVFVYLIVMATIAQLFPKILSESFLTSLVVLAAGSKALIRWLTDAILGDAVYLGGFFAVTLLVFVVMLARAGVRRVIE